MADEILPELDGLPNLAPDLAALFLIKLPVNQLVRCIRISSSWRDFIKSTFFANFLLHINCKKLLFFVVSFQAQPRPPLVSLHFDSPQIEEYVPLSDRFFSGFTEMAGKNTLFVSSCKGLICLFGPKPCTEHREIFLWNPYLRKILILPRSNFPCIKGCDHLFGLGYDHNTADYKLLSFRFTDSYPYHCDVELYSVNRRSWRILPDMETEYYLTPLSVEEPGHSFSSSAFVCHALHWVAGRAHNENEISLVLKFDMREELFREIELPEELASFHVDTLRVLVFKETKLAVVHFDAKANILHLWVMERYGDSTSWFKLGVVDSGGRDLSLLTFRANNELMMQYFHEEIDSYNLLTGHSARVADDINEDLCYVVNHVDSLALLGVSAWPEWHADE